MRTSRRSDLFLMVALLAAYPAPVLAQPATVSFAAGKQATYPGSIKAGAAIDVDLTAIPKDAGVFRAVLHVGCNEAEANRHHLAPVKVTTNSDVPLAFLPPRFQAFDATDAVQKAVNSGAGKVSFRVVSFPGHEPAKTRLDVTAAVKAKNAVGAVKDLRAWHRDGQTFLTWSEVDSPLTTKEVSFKQWKEMQSKRTTVAKQVRYRIYRHDQPITPATIGKAVLVDEVGPLTCWNPEYFGVEPRDEVLVPRYVVEEGKGPVAPGTGIYVHNPVTAGKAYYAVSLAVDGEEDLASLGATNTTRDAVAEQVGPGTPVLQRIESPKDFNYVAGPTLSYFVRWEAPPRANMPSRPYDYLVAVPGKLKEPAPVGLHLHCWGGNLNNGYGWWYNAAQGAILISTNQVPYDWWTGYHEHLGTRKSWSEGAIRDYTQARVLGFLDWARTRWKMDPAHVFTGGISMGGSGSPNFGIRHADRIAWVVSWVGVHSPARSPHFRESYEHVYGKLDWKLPFQDGKTPAFTWFDDEWFVRQNPAAETPLICFCNGKNDSGIGWPQARAFWKALQETRRPHVFVWGQGGHSQRATLPGPKPGERELGIDVRVDRSLPAFTGCSLDGNPGNGDPKDGDPAGQSNVFLYWTYQDHVDRAKDWSMELRLNGEAPKQECTVDVTPRRCQEFKPKAGAKLAWTNVSLGTRKQVQSGTLVVDTWGLATVPGVLVSKGGTRLALQAMER
jgi:hypothetical protein